VKSLAAPAILRDRCDGSSVAGGLEPRHAHPSSIRTAFGPCLLPPAPIVRVSLTRHALDAPIRVLIEMPSRHNNTGVSGTLIAWRCAQLCWGT
jgi:hypothetical protein